MKSCSKLSVLPSLSVRYIFIILNELSAVLTMLVKPVRNESLMLTDVFNYRLRGRIAIISELEPSEFQIDYSGAPLI